MELKEQKEIAERNLIKALTAHSINTKQVVEAVNSVNLSSKQYHAVKPQIDSYLKQYDLRVLQYTQEVENLDRKIRRAYMNEKIHVYKPFARLNRQLVVL
jgi:hypothetical protein